MTPFDVYAITAAAGQKLVAALWLPTGLVTGAASTIAGGTFTGAQAIPAGAAAVYLSLSETNLATVAGDKVYTAQSLVQGTALPDTDERVYTAEVRVVSVGVDLTNYASSAAGFVASTTVISPRNVPPTLAGGYLIAGRWMTPADLRSVNGEAFVAVEGSGGGGVRTIKFETRELSTAR